MQSSSKPSSFISVVELKRLIDSSSVRTVLVDTRPTDVFAHEHIPGATNIPDCFTYLTTSDEEGVKRFQEKFVNLFSQAGISPQVPNQHVVFYENGLTSGFAQSCRGCFILRYLGHPRVSVLNGGLTAWKKEGGPVSALPSSREPVTFTPHIRDDLVATKEDVLRALDTGSSILLDVRDKEEWIGESSSPYGKDFTPRKGRLAGAKWLEWYQLMKTDEDGVSTVRPMEEVLEILKQKGLSPNDDIIIYCFKGSRASNTLLILEDAGFTKVRNYFASWNEWSRHEALPIDSQVLTLDK